jgi:hypothetical protein
MRAVKVKKRPASSGFNRRFVVFLLSGVIAVNFYLAQKRAGANRRDVSTRENSRRVGRRDERRRQLFARKHRRADARGRIFTGSGVFRVQRFLDARFRADGRQCYDRRTRSDGERAGHSQRPPSADRARRHDAIFVDRKFRILPFQ